jgi:ribosome-associated translation inhibitor RaiA
VAAAATALAADRARSIRARSYAEPAREAQRMSGTENSPPGTPVERLRLGAGFAAADRPRILAALSALAPHLSGWEHDQVDLEVSLKDTEGPDQKVTLQAWLAGRAHLMATSHERDLEHALAEVRQDLIRQIEDERSRREPRKRRKTRYRTT